MHFWRMLLWLHFMILRSTRFAASGREWLIFLDIHTCIFIIEYVSFSVLLGSI